MITVQGNQLYSRLVQLATSSTSPDFQPLVAVANVCTVEHNTGVYNTCS